MTPQTLRPTFGNSSLRYKKFLGIADEHIPSDQYIGTKLGIAPDFALQIIKQMGSYGEIYSAISTSIMPGTMPILSTSTLISRGIFFSNAFEMADNSSPTF